MNKRKHARKSLTKPQLIMNSFDLEMVTLKVIFVTFQNLSKIHSTSVKHYFLHENFSLSHISCSLLCVTTEPLNQPQALRALQASSCNHHYIRGVQSFTQSLERQTNWQIKLENLTLPFGSEFCEMLQWPMVFITYNTCLLN